MRPDDLMTFVRLLEQADQLTRISVAVDPNLELAAIVDRVCKGAGPGRALLFEDVRGSALPVATNLFGSMERVAWALGTTDLAGLAQRLERDLQATGASDGIMALEQICARDEWQPVLVSRPAWQEHDLSNEGLAALPQVVAWPGDGGPYLTLAQVYTRHPDGGPLNCGMYRIQCHDRCTATIRCRPGSGAADHLAAWQERNRAMPVAIALGGPPSLCWAAGAPLPAAVEETAFCSYLTGQRLAMSHCQASDLLVPATAEVVIEGLVEPGALKLEGPFGNHTGSYDSAAAAPLLLVQTVHARDGALLPWTLVGPPPMENLWLARATECLFLPLVKWVLPAVRALHLPASGIFHRAALVTIDPADDRPFAEIAGALWGTLLLQGSRLLVIGVSDHDPDDVEQVFWRTLNRVDWERDLLLVDGRLAIDARHLPVGAPVHTDPATCAKVLARWSEYRIDPAGGAHR